MKRFLAGAAVVVAVGASVGCRTTDDAVVEVKEVPAVPAAPAAEAEAAGDAAAPLIVCEATGELEGGTSFGLQLHGAGVDKDVRLAASFNMPPFGDEKELRGHGATNDYPATVQLDGGGVLTITREAARLEGHVAWHGRTDLGGLWQAMERQTLVCDDGGLPEAGQAAAMLEDGVTGEALLRHVRAARFAAAEKLGKEPELRMIAAQAVKGVPACDGFLSAQLYFAAGADEALVELKATAAGEDCVYEPSVRVGAEAGKRPFGAARRLAGLERVQLGYAEAAEKVNERYPQVKLTPGFVLLVPQAAAARSPAYLLRGKACGRDAAVLVDANNGAASSGAPAPGACR